MAENSRTHEHWGVLNREMDACLAQREYGQAMRCLSPDVKACVLGLDLKPQSLGDLHTVVRNVKRSMFCGAQHVFCVYARPRRDENGWEWADGAVVPWYVPEAHGPGACDWEFRLPERQTVELYVKTLLSAPTPVLYLWWQGIHDETEMAPCLGREDNGKYTNDFILEAGEPYLLTDTLMVEDKHDNDVLRVKDSRGGVLLRMSFHSAAWSKERDNKALVYAPRGTRDQEDTRHWLAADTRAGLTALLARLRVGGQTEVGTVAARVWVAVEFQGTRRLSIDKPVDSQRDVVDFLREVCLSYHMDLSRCTVDLNGHAYEMSSGKRMGDLANAPGCREPKFVLHS
jgi:hypothetical protein